MEVDKEEEEKKEREEERKKGRIRRKRRIGSKRRIRRKRWKRRRWGSSRINRYHTVTLTFLLTGTFNEMLGFFFLVMQESRRTV